MIFIKFLFLLLFYIISKKIYINYDQAHEQWNGTGGRVPYIENQDIKKKVFPIFYSDVNIYSNSHQIVNNKNPTHKFNLNNQFVFEPKESADIDEFDFEDLSHLMNEEIVINENKKLPFHILLVHNRFSIIKKFYQNVTSKYIRLLHPKLITEGEISHVKKIFTMNGGSLAKAVIGVIKYGKIMKAISGSRTGKIAKKLYQKIHLDGIHILFLILVKQNIPNIMEKHMQN